MKELLQSIMTYFNSNSDSDFYNAINGNLYFHRVPAIDAAGDDIVYPYAVYFDVSRVPDYYFDGEMFEEISIQFDVFDNSLESALDIENYLDYLHSLFDDAEITLTNYRCVKFERELTAVLIEGEEQQMIWHGYTQYRVLLEKI